MRVCFIICASLLLFMCLFVLSLFEVVLKKGMGEIMVVLIKGLKSGDRELKRERAK